MAKNNSFKNGSKKGKPTGKANKKSNGKPAASSEIQKPFLIVGIGASAGGFEAFGEVLKNLPTDTEMAFVFVQHLDPRHESKNWSNCLSRSTKMPVISIQNNLRVEPDKVYILPQNRRLEIEEGVFKLSPRRDTDGQHLPIDGFFQSLAQDQKNCAIGVVLSGSNADGTLGLKEIKSEGGITFAQDERTASFHQMPSSAIATGCVDFIFPPHLIAKELARIAEHPALKRKVKADEELLAESETELTKIFAMLRALHGVDFSHYKHSTLKRRILRRMVVQKTQHLSDYTKYLREHPAEIDALFHDLLINVTAFFRDKQMYEALRKKIFPKLVKQTAGGNAIRIWVPGCSSGEEVYSLAIVLFEFLGRNAENKSIQIFATDISETVLARARAGIYSEAVLRDVSPERLRRFFHKADGGYQISKFVRDCCVFARQNVIEDPPFSKLDLISCRNVLIYLGPLLQKKVMPIFHYALKNTGHLVLGGSETIGLFSDLFTLADKKNKIYSKRESISRPEIGFAPMIPHEAVEVPKPKPVCEPDGAADLQKQVDRMLLTQYAPSGIVINSHMEVQQFRGQTSSYIEHLPGDASLNLMKMARPDLVVDLRTAINRAMKTDSAVRKEGIEFEHNGKHRLVNIQVVPIRIVDSTEQFYAILFEEKPAPELKSENGKNVGPTKHSERESARLRDELSSTKESLQAIIEEQEATNEELKSANEEIQSANEELQSTNEELETAKEELQSTNEELTTLNEELQGRNSELSQVNNDLGNLLGSVSMPILMLGNDMTIRRFTPLAERVFNLIPTDVGRRITDINPNIIIPNFEKSVAEVLETLRIQEHDVQDRDGRWFSLRIRPYRTTENKIDGVVVLLVDINELKRGLEEITGLVRQPLLTLHGDLCVNKANDAFLKTFQVGREEVEGKIIYQADKGAWNIPGLKIFLEGVLPEKHRVENYEINHAFPKIGQRKLLFSGRQLYHQGKGTQLILLAIEDVTEEKN